MPITAAPITDPMPGVMLTFTAATAGVPVTLTVWRRTPDGVDTIVRGTHHMTFTTAAYVRDFEAPIGVPLVYWCDIEAGEELGQDSITLPASGAWFSDPMNPRLGFSATCGVHGDATLPVRLQHGTLEDVSTDPQSTTEWVIGARLPVLFASSAVEITTDLVLRTTTREDHDQVLTVLTEAQPVLLRGLPCMWDLPPLAYLSGKIKSHREPTAAHPDRRVITATVTLVRAPSGTRIVPLYSYQDVQSAWAALDAYEAVEAAVHPKAYLDIEKDPRP